jgi:heme exporter protein D
VRISGGYMLIFWGIWFVIFSHRSSSFAGSGSAIAFWVWLIFGIFLFFYIPSAIEKQKEKKRLKNMQRELWRKTQLKEKFGKLEIENLMFNNSLSQSDKLFLLEEMYGYDREEAIELLKTTSHAEKKAKLKKVKRNIHKKANEIYLNMPSDYKRISISDDIKEVVWNRDGGKCVKCGSQENLEFDHIIPVSKGGGNTARNIQVLCEKCNREKKDNI